MRASKGENSNGRIRFADALPPEAILHADETLLRPALLNLLSNALKYSGADCAVDFTVAQENGRCRFEIRDRGIGIPKEDQAHLFESFQRAKNVGTIPGNGLGLVIAQKCIRLQGGNLDFESVENEGTTFRATLPWECCRENETA